MKERLSAAAAAILVKQTLIKVRSVSNDSTSVESRLLLVGVGQWIEYRTNSSENGIYLFSIAMKSKQSSIQVGPESF